MVEAGCFAVVFNKKNFVGPIKYNEIETANWI